MEGRVMVLLVLICAAVAAVTWYGVLAPLARFLELSGDELAADLAGLRAGFGPMGQAGMGGIGALDREVPSVVLARVAPATRK